MKILDLVSGSEIRLDQLQNQEKTFSYLEVRDLKELDLEILSEKLKIEIVDLEDVYDPEERPRVDYDIQNDYIEFVLRFPLDYYNEIKSIPVICFIKPKIYCIVLHQHDSFISTIQTKQTKKFKTEINQSNIVISSLMKYLTGTTLQTERIIKQFQQIKDDFENQIFKARETSGLKDIFQLSNAVVLFENNMKGNLIQLKKLIKHEKLEVKLNSELAGKLDDIETDFEQYYDQVRIMREIINSSLDAYGGIISNNVNEVMKTLTIFTILLSSPILIASVYGMNIELPFSTHPFAIYFIVILSLTISLGMIFYMKRKNIL